VIPEGTGVYFHLEGDIIQRDVDLASGIADGRPSGGRQKRYPHGGCSLRAHLIACFAGT
jgi:hypothetical protein